MKHVLIFSAILVAGKALAFDNVSLNKNKIPGNVAAARSAKELVAIRNKRCTFTSSPDTVIGISVTPNGNVGIGKKASTFKLDVNGTFNVSSNSTFGGSVRASSVGITGGLSSQFLKADGSVDNNTYITAATAGNFSEILPSSYAYYGTWGNFPGDLATEARNWLTSNIAGTASDAKDKNENHGVSMDFGSSVPLRRIVLYSYATRNINSYRVDYSNDNVNWTTIEIFPQPIAASPTTMTFNLTKNISARYWRWALHSWTTEREVANYYFYEIVAYL